MATVLFHALVLLLAGAFLALAVPRFIPGFAELNVPLPPTTRLTLGISEIFRHFWSRIIPVLLVLDVGLCWLLQKFGGRRQLLWGSAVVTGLACLAVILAAITLLLPGA